MPTISHVSTAVIEANFDYTYVCVELDDGTTGYGESFFAPGLTQAIRTIGDVLIGHDPRNVRALTDLMRIATSASSGPHAEGSLLHAISGIEAALWDVTGKILGEPVWRLLGGRYRTHIPVYADLHAGVGLSSIDNLLRKRVPAWASPSKQTEVGEFYWQSVREGELDLDAIVGRIREAAADGFRCVKLDMDVFEDPRQAGDSSLGTAAVDRIAERVHALRRAVDDSVEIAYDCHWRFDIPTASRLNHAISDSRPYWLEDPVNPTGRGLARVAQAGATPIASGENAYSLDGVVSLAEDGGLDVATPDVQKIGGIAESLLVADWTNRHDIAFAPHCIASPLGFMAAAHVMAAAPNVSYLEFHGRDVHFWHDIVTTPVIVDGFAPVIDAPGLGVEFNWDTLRAYSAPGEPFFREGVL
jgi:L-alanine-DL-glutamate epimerase-like enolase superfamily enzyme